MTIKVGDRVSYRVGECCGSGEVVDLLGGDMLAVSRDDGVACYILASNCIPIEDAPAAVVAAVNDEPQDELAYPWNAAPEWAQWAATDSDGEQWWFERQPNMGVLSWRNAVGGRCACFAIDSGTNWIASLRARPAETLTDAEHVDDVTSERDQLAKEVERLCGDAECLESNRREVTRLADELARLAGENKSLRVDRDEARDEVARLTIDLSESRAIERQFRGEVERLSRSLDEHGRAVNRLTSERDQAVAEVERLRDQLRNDQGVAAAAWQRKYDELVAELAKLREQPAEVVWACPKEWKQGWRMYRSDDCLSVHGPVSVSFTASALMMLHGHALPPQNGTYEIVSLGRAVLVK